MSGLRGGEMYTGITKGGTSFTGWASGDSVIDHMDGFRIYAGDMRVCRHVIPTRQDGEWAAPKPGVQVVMCHVFDHTSLFSPGVWDGRWRHVRLGGDWEFPATRKPDYFLMLGQEVAM